MILEGDITIPYKWTPGPVAGRFLAELRDNRRIMAVKCGACGKVFVPPPDICGQCFKLLDDWVELSGDATVVAVSVVNHLMPWSAAPVPYSLAVIRLDGADTDLIHMVGNAVKRGDRVRPSYKQDRTGSILDIEFFTRATTE